MTDEQGKLKPMECLDKDYYLGERDGWFSGGEDRDSDSSDDELQRELRRLAGVRRDCASHVDDDESVAGTATSSGDARGKKRQISSSSRRASSGEMARTRQGMCDEFEASMDAQLDVALEQRTAAFLGGSGSVFVEKSGQAAIASATRNKQRGQILSTVKESDEMDVDEGDDGPAKKEARTDTVSANVSNAQSSSSSSTKKKAVRFANGECGTTDTTTSSVFASGEENADAMKAKKEDVEFYDEDEDETNEAWVREKQRRSSGANAPGETGTSKRKKKTSSDSDAVLSCPACMTLLTRDCQQHAIYKDQYRAIFVENCNVQTDETLFMPTSGAKKDLKRKKVKVPQTNTVLEPTASVAECSRADLFHPVQCSICATRVGVIDAEEIYHFFNVLTGYA